MRKYAFVGAVLNVGSLTFDAVGQIGEFSDEQYLGMVRKAHFIPVDEFEALEFDPQHLARFGTYGNHEGGPAEFREKLDNARQIWRDIAANVAAGTFKFESAE